MIPAEIRHVTQHRMSGTAADAAAERETVITWSDADNGIATVWTAQRPMVTRLQRIRGAERAEVHRTDAGAWTGETWRVPVAAVLPRNPRVLRLSEAEKAQRASRLRARPIFHARVAESKHSLVTREISSETAPSGAGSGSVQEPQEVPTA